MASFNLRDFTLRLIAEALFYDDEYDVLGNLSLIDERAGKEQFVAYFSTDDGKFVIEEATQWEAGSTDDDEIGYALAVDSKLFKAFETANAAAVTLLELSEARGLMPSVTLLFEDDELD